MVEVHGREVEGLPDLEHSSVDLKPHGHGSVRVRSPSYAGVVVSDSNSKNPTVITIHGSASRKNCLVTILKKGYSVGSWPGSTRSTATIPWRGPNIPGASSTTPEKAVGSQIAPTPFGP